MWDGLPDPAAAWVMAGRARVRPGHDTKTQENGPVVTQKDGPAMTQNDASAVTQNGRLAVPQNDGPAATQAAQSLRIATALVHPADARCTFTGKHTMSNPSAGKSARFPSFSIWK